MLVLVTGAGGYVGSVLIPKLSKRGFGVIAIDRYFFGNKLIPDNFNVKKILADVRCLDGKIFNGVDAIIDLAAISNDPSGEIFPQETKEINIYARLNNAKKAKKRGVGRYLMASSCSVYGYNNHFIKETDKLNPLSNYAKANVEAEKGLFELADESFCVTSLRQSTLCGLSPRMRFDLVLNIMVYHAFTNRTVKVFGGKQWRPLLDVQDTTDAMIYMLEQDTELINKEVFNLGSNKFSNWRIDNLAKLIQNTIDTDITIQTIGEEEDPRSYKVSFDKIEQLGFKAKYNLERSIKDIWAALKNNQTDKTTETVTLAWYQQLIKWNNLLNKITINGRIL